VPISFYSQMYKNQNEQTRTEEDAMDLVGDL
jgi:hypothetical protein